MKKNFIYPLLENAFSNQDINQGIKVLKSKRLTMSKKTYEFEHYFSKLLGTKYSLMVNSGSSAMLLAFALLTNIKRKIRLKKNDEVLIPAICWSTSFWPIIQFGLKPKFIDVNIETYTPSLEIIKKNISKKTKAVVLINILGNCSEIDKIKKHLEKKNIILIEDNCEALGSKYKNKYLGTYGEVSGFSFYYSHQITSGEGGAVICKNKADYQILCSLRAHGWDRDYNLKNKKKFNFVNQGFNLRPLDISAAIGLNQIKRLKYFKKMRSLNRDKIISNLKSSANWKDQFKFFQPSQNLDPSWFGLPLLIDKKYMKNKKKFLNYLNVKKIETRPILSGNFLNQECIKLYKLKFNPKKFLIANEIEERGFFIGLPTRELKLTEVSYLCKCLLYIEKI